MSKTVHRKNKVYKNKNKNKTRKYKGGFPWQLALTTLVIAVSSLNVTEAMPGFSPILLNGNKIYMDDTYYNRLSPEIQNIMTIERTPLGSGKHVFVVGSNCGDVIDKLKEIENTFSGNNNVKMIVDRAIETATCDMK